MCPRHRSCTEGSTKRGAHLNREANGSDRNLPRWQLLATGTVWIPALELGRKLVAAGALGAPEDVVFLSVAELQSGDILVCRTTAAPWTPLYAIAAAVVTNIGGALSHTAIVAREYAIPAVVGTGVGTEQIRDGDLLRVAGSAGRVIILERGR